MSKILKILCISICISQLAYSQHKTNPIDWVDPFIGTAGHGHTFPGATSPFGLVQLSPDTDDTGWDWCSGYNYQDSTIIGFSHTHLSGTGISDLADVLIMPYLGKIRLLPSQKNEFADGYSSKFSHDTEVAHPGYYAVLLEKHGIKAEMTAFADIGVHRYTFPKSDSANIIIDLLHGLDRHRSWLTERVLDSELSVVDSVTLAGFRVSSGWANVQNVYFEIRFSKPFVKFGIAQHDVFREGSKLGRGRNIKGVMTFTTEDQEAIEVVVKISNQPITQRSNLFQNFDTIKTTCMDAWDKELNKITIDASDSIRTNFYTALYHAAIAPNKLNQSTTTTPLSKSFNDEYGTLSLWDIYRAAYALNTLLHPIVAEGMLGTMHRAYEKNHYLPVWKLWEDEVNCMVGTPSIPILVEALLKNIGTKQKEALYTALKASMITDNPVAPWTTFDQYGYIPNDIGELFSVSKTLEMCYANGCAAELVRQLFPEDKEQLAFYEDRSLFYKNLFDPKTGFFRGKNKKGEFTTPFDPNVTNENEFVESTPWQYLFHVQHDISGLIQLLGGKKQFIKKLDALFEAAEGKIDEHILDITGLVGQYAHGNEPSHHIAYLYNYAGQPWKTQSRVHDLCNRFYHATPSGLCGNEDCGQMSAWYIFSTLGFYPVHPASGTYDLGVPLVRNASIKLGNNTLHIKTKQYSETSKYVKSVRLNGVRLSKPLISHQQIMQGGILEYELSEEPSKDCYRDE